MRHVNDAVPSVEEFLRILWNALYQHLEMQVGSSRSPCISNLRDLLPSLNQIAFLDEGFGRMGIARDQSIAVVDFDNVPILTLVLLRHDDPSCSSKNGGAWACRKIQPRMQCGPTGDGVNSPAEDRP